jgi:hypothetical protein
MPPSGIEFRATFRAFGIDRLLRRRVFELMDRGFRYHVIISPTAAADITRAVEMSAALRNLPFAFTGLADEIHQRP